MDDMPLISAKLFLLFLARIFIHLLSTILYFGAKLISLYLFLAFFGGKMS